jgi:hypothetical protein
LKPWFESTIKNTCVIGGNLGAVDSPPGCGFGVVLVGVVLVGVVLGVLSGVVELELVDTGVTSGAGDGGGVEAGATTGWLEAVVEGETATTSGATALLSCAGLSAEPTSTPNASSAINATPVIDSEGIGESPSEPASSGSLSAAASDPRSYAAGWAWPSSSCATTPIRSVIANGSGPRRAPHSTQ